MTKRVLLATRDDACAAALAPALARRGYRVDVVRTNLDLVFALTSSSSSSSSSPAAPHVLVLDARRGSFGAASLEWLRDDPVSCAIVALVDTDGGAAAQAELAEAAALLRVASGKRGHMGRVARRIDALVTGLGPRDLLRWTPPRARPRLRLDAPLLATARGADA